MQVKAERVAVKKMVPRRPRALLRGAVSQQPVTRVGSKIGKSEGLKKRRNGV
jgi:hypothetical protein